METKKKKNHVLILTSDADHASVHRYKIKPWIVSVILALFCVLLGGVVGYFIFENTIWQDAAEKNKERMAYVAQLEKHNAELQSQLEETEKTSEKTIADLQDEIQILSNTLNEKVEREAQLAEELGKQSIPSEFPLTGAATYTIKGNEAVICEFTPTEGSAVVATAKGTVIAVNDDLDYGHNVWVDHGNDYITIYRYSGDAVVKQGDAVVHGTTLFLIKDSGKPVGYQMLKNGEYINPLDMMAING